MCTTSKKCYVSLIRDELEEEAYLEDGEGEMSHRFTSLLANTYTVTVERRVLSCSTGANTAFETIFTLRELFTTSHNSHSSVNSSMNVFALSHF